MTFTRGEAVTVENERNRLTGSIELVSPNQKSIAITFEGAHVAIHRTGGMIITRALPITQDPPDTFTDLFGDGWTIKRP